MKNIAVTSVLVLALLLAAPALAANYYASPAGNAAWTSATNIATPCSVTTALANARAGDTVFYRGGTYTINTGLITNSGNDGTSTNRIVHKAYPGETPNLVINAGGDVALYIDSDYVTLDGLTIHAGNFNAEGAIIKIGDNNSATHAIVQNCTLHMTSTNSLDNVDAIYLKGVRLANYALIQNNLIEGPEANIAGGVFIGGAGGNSLGIKVLNNVIHGFNVGFYVKHVNADTSLATGAEVAYNYFYGITGDGAFIGIPAFFNIHDNIAVCSGTCVMFGINGGGSNGTGTVFNHNTLRGAFFAANEAGGMINYTISNNIMPRYEVYGGSGNTWSYNMYGSGASRGTGDLANTSPVFTGGSAPTTVAGFALTAASPGKGRGSDGKDLGADTTKIGRQTLSNPQGLKVSGP